MTSSDGRWLDPAALVGLDGPDVGCDSCFELLDEYVEALAAGSDVAALYPGMLEHLVGCPACAEEAASLLELIVQPPPVQPPGR